MDDKIKEISRQIASLLDSQRLMVLATYKDGQPYTSLVAFAASRDLRSLYFLTPENTRKYDNLSAHPKVSVLVTDSRNKADDIYTSVSATGVGTATVMEKSKIREAQASYLKKHPQLKAFADKASTQFVRIAVKKYVFVNRFQNVMEFDPNP